MCFHLLLVLKWGVSHQKFDTWHAWAPYMFFLFTLPCCNLYVLFSCVPINLNQIIFNLSYTHILFEYFLMDNLRHFKMVLKYFLHVFSLSLFLFFKCSEQISLNFLFLSADQLSVCERPESYSTVSVFFWIHWTLVLCFI